MYTDFFPSENLKRLVSTYFSLEISDAPGDFFAPDITHTSMIVTIKSNVEINRNGTKVIPPVVSLMGAFDSPFYFSYLDNNITSFIADFKPIGLYELSRKSGSVFANKFVDASDIWDKNEVSKLYEMISSPISVEERITLLDNFLETKAPEILDEKSLIVEKAGETAKNCNYMWSVKEISRDIGVSETALRRAFKEVLGISPKQYFARALFEEVLKQYVTDKQNTIEVLTDSPFYDFSHINKWFKKFALTSPSEFVNYDIHFIEKVLSRMK